MNPATNLTHARWRKASRSISTGADCVETASLHGLIAVRDSKEPDGPKLFLSPDGWRRLAERVTGGELDV